jgi:hypothetical protein
MQFNSCCHLETLSPIYIKWRDENISKTLNKIVTGCPNLHSLTLYECSSTALHECLIATLPKWTNLQSLTLNCNHHIESFIAGTLPSLKTLEIITDLTDIQVVGISNTCPVLERCSIYASGSSDDALLDDALLKLVENCSNLHYLTTKASSKLKFMLRKLGLCC